MRKILIPMMALLLAGCVNDSASYYSDGRDHALTLLRAQKYFWSDAATLTLVIARLPDCQRRHALTQAPAASVDIDVFAGADASWTLRSASTLWRVDTGTCTISAGSAAGADAAALGERVGSFKVAHKRLRFEAAKPGTAPAR